MVHRMIVGSKRENRGGSEGTTSNVSRETATSASSPLHSSDSAVGGNLTAGAGQPPASGNLHAFGWVLRRLSAIGLAALDSIQADDPEGDVRDAVKPFLDALHWEGFKLTGRQKNGE